LFCGILDRIPLLNDRLWNKITNLDIITEQY
jgi:hypothetical protein